MRIVTVFKERLVYTRSITSPRWSYFAWHRLGGDHADGISLRTGLVRWFTAILTYLPVLPFQLIIVSNVRFHAHDFYLADVGL